jgi:hypothetical protein
MKYKALFLMAIVTAGGCATHPVVRDVELDLPVSMADSCVPLKANVYGMTVDGRMQKLDSPTAASVTVPSNATSLYINCEETGTRPRGCESAPGARFPNAQEFLVNFNSASSYTLECRITGWSTLEPQMDVLVTKPTPSQLEPAIQQ